MDVTIYRVLSDLPNADEFLFADELKADSVAASQNTTVVSRDFSLPKGWDLVDINDEAIIFDTQKNPYNVRLYGEAPAEDALFGAIVVPFFNNGISTVLEPAE